MIGLRGRPLGPLFDTVDEKIAYVRQHNLKVQLKRILEQHQRFDELAQEYLDEDDLDHGVQYYVEGYRCHHTSSSIVRAVELAIEYIESVILVEGVYRKGSHDLARSLVSRVQPYAGQVDNASCRAVSPNSIRVEACRAYYIRVDRLVSCASSVQRRQFGSSEVLRLGQPRFTTTKADTCELSCYKERLLATGRFCRRSSGAPQDLG